VLVELPIFPSTLMGTCCGSAQPISNYPDRRYAFLIDNHQGSRNPGGCF
jgi:hypothetical protein